MMKKKNIFWLSALIVSLVVGVFAWKNYGNQTDEISKSQEKKVKELLMKSSEDINSGMESVQRLSMLENNNIQKIKN